MMFPWQLLYHYWLTKCEYNLNFKKIQKSWMAPSVEKKSISKNLLCCLFSAHTIPIVQVYNLFPLWRWNYSIMDFGFRSTKNCFWRGCESKFFIFRNLFSIWVCYSLITNLFSSSKFIELVLRRANWIVKWNPTNKDYYLIHDVCNTGKQKVL